MSHPSYSPTQHATPTTPSPSQAYQLQYLATALAQLANAGFTGLTAEQLAGRLVGLNEEGLEEALRVMAATMAFFKASQ